MRNREMRRSSSIRIVIGATALAISMAAGVVPAAAQQANEITLTFDTVQWVNTISTRAVVIGTIDCTLPTQDLQVRVSVTQEAGERDRSAGGSTTVDCNGPTRWMALTYAGNFESDVAAIEGTVYEEDYEARAHRSDTASLIGCTRIGSLDDDVLRGKDGRDRLCGLDGDDTITGKGGGDLLRGGPGNDTLRGGGKRDVLLGGLGDDTEYGGSGNDTLSGDEGDDYLNGGRGKDKCVGGPGSNRRIRC